MTDEELQAILKSNKKLTANEILETIFQLKQRARQNKTNAEKDREYYFYDGEINAYCLCLDLIEKFTRIK